MNWNNVLEHNKKDVYNSFNKFFWMFETLLGTYALIQKLTKVNVEVAMLIASWVN